MFEMSEHVYVFHVAYKSANNQSMLLRNYIRGFQGYKLWKQFK